MKWRLFIRVSELLAITVRRDSSLRRGSTGAVSATSFDRIGLEVAQRGFAGSKQSYVFLDKKMADAAGVTKV